MILDVVVIVFGVLAERVRTKDDKETTFLALETTELAFCSSTSIPLCSWTLGRLLCPSRRVCSRQLCFAHFVQQGFSIYLPLTKTTTSTEQIVLLLSTREHFLGCWLLLCASTPTSQMNDDCSYSFVCNCSASTCRFHPNDFFCLPFACLLKCLRCSFLLPPRRCCWLRCRCLVFGGLMAR